MAWVRRRKSGWQACWRDPAGRVRSKTFRLKDAAERHARAQEDRVEDGSYIDPKAAQVRLRAYWSEYLARADDGRVQLEPTTRAKWKALFDRYIDPTLGAMPVGRITRADVRDLIAGIGARGQAHATIGLLRMLLYRALDEGRIATNPAARPGLGEQRQAEPEIASPDELDAIADAIGGRYRALVYVAAYGGLRLSEALALRSRSIDFLGRRARIDAKLVEVRGGVHIGAPKTESSKRWVTLPVWVIEELARHLELYPRAPEDLLFTTSRDKPIRRTVFNRAVWKPALARAGITRPLQARHLRHTGASLVHEAGFSERDVADRLGHTSTRMASRYVKTYEDRQRRIADAIGALGRRRAARVLPEGTQGP